MSSFFCSTDSVEASTSLHQMAYDNDHLAAIIQFRHCSLIMFTHLHFWWLITRLTKMNTCLQHLFDTIEPRSNQFKSYRYIGKSVLHGNIWEKISYAGPTLLISRVLGWDFHQAFSYFLWDMRDGIYDRMVAHVAGIGYKVVYIILSWKLPLLWVSL